MSRVDVGARRAGLEHCRDVPLFPAISGWERSENRLNRLLSCVGMSKILEWFLLFLATMASLHAEDRRLAKDGGEVRIQVSVRLITCDARLQQHEIIRIRESRNWLASRVPLCGARGY